MTALTDLIAKAETALHGKPPFGHSLLADFGQDGKLYVYPNNQVAAVSALCTADCTITTSLQTLNDLEAGKTTAFKAWWSGALKIDGDRSIAEKFAALITGKES